MGDYRAGLKDGVRDEADAYAEDQPDVALWEGGRCLAVIRPSAGGDPIVSRFDDQVGEEPFSYPRPDPHPDHDRWLAEIIRRRGATAVYWAFWDSRLGPPAPEPRSIDCLTEAERSVLDFVRQLGEREALQRLYLSGPYQAIWNAIDRLGTDAVAELRRQIEAGKPST